MTINRGKLIVVTAFIALFLGGCATKDIASDLPKLKGELQPVNTDEKYRIMIEKQHSSAVENVENANE
jgi:outer membrane lipoprotein-sorting protein